MKQGFFSTLKQCTNQLLAFGYAILFVLIGGRAAVYVQQTMSALWPCHYVEAWWQVQRSSPTTLACAASGRETTVVFGALAAFAMVFALMRQLEWRLRLLACVTGLYFLFRLGYLFNVLGHGNSLQAIWHAIYVTRLELLGLLLFALLLWSAGKKPASQKKLVLGTSLILILTLAYELVFPGNGSTTLTVKALAPLFLLALVCFLLGSLPARTARWLGADT